MVAGMVGVATTIALGLGDQHEPASARMALVVSGSVMALAQCHFGPGMSQRLNAEQSRHQYPECNVFRSMIVAAVHRPPLSW